MRPNHKVCSSHIAGRSVVSLFYIVYSPTFLPPLFQYSFSTSVPSAITPGCICPSSNALLVKHTKSMLTAHLNSFIPNFSHTWNQPSTRYSVSIFPPGLHAGSALLPPAHPTSWLLLSKKKIVVSPNFLLLYYKLSNQIPNLLYSVLCWFCTDLRIFLCLSQFYSVAFSNK